MSLLVRRWPLRRRARQGPCDMCAGAGLLDAAWVFACEDECTCGAGDPRDPLVLHSYYCDAVPCPFCALGP